jgi:carbon storage regulator
MLVLTRRLGEEILIGDDIRVTIVGLQGGQVRVGVSAPRVVPVKRRELDERRPREARSALSPLTRGCVL